MRTGGFVGGASLGLLLALLVVGAGTTFSLHPSAHLAASQTGPSAGFSGSAVTSSSANSSGAVANGAAASTSSSSSSASQALEVGGGVAAPQASNQSSSNSAGKTISSGSASFGESSTSASSSSSATAPGSLSAIGSSITQPSPPGSALSMLPAEGAKNLLGTVAPLLIGLVVGLMVYGAYSRRQDASS